MKKIYGRIAVALLCAAVAAATLCLSACFSTQNYYGEYAYENVWVEGQFYGVKVKVTVQSDDKGERIRAVEVVESDYVEVTPTWEGKYVWDEGLESLLLSYRGRYITDVLLSEVTVNASGEPSSVADNGYLISGATVGSGRLLLAVQNALEQATEDMGYTVSAGEYKYENVYAPGQYYGIKVKVVAKDGRIMGVGVLSSDYVEVTDSWTGKAAWQKGLDGLLESYVGLSVDDILKVTVPCDASGAPLATESGGLSSESGYLISGATVGSGRLLLAVQNALSSIR